MDDALTLMRDGLNKEQKKAERLIKQYFTDVHGKADIAADLNAAMDAALNEPNLVLVVELLRKAWERLEQHSSQL